MASSVRRVFDDNPLMVPEAPSLAAAPRLSVAEAQRLARDGFDIQGTATELPSERDQNFRLAAEDGRLYVLKVANAGERREILEAENACMRQLAATGLAPTPIAAPNGAEIIRKSAHFARLITWIEGDALAATRHHPEPLLRDIGRSIGLLGHALESFDHPALHRVFHWDLAHGPAIIERHLASVEDAELRKLIAAFVEIYREQVSPLLPSLPCSAIHGDLNDYNVLVDAAALRVTGVVDFGDMVYSHTVNDLAIAMSYASLGKRDPLGAAAAVVAGYHAVRALSDTEVAALFGLMTTRLCLSVVLAWAQQAEAPHRAYLGISQAPIRKTLPILASIHPRLAHYRLRDACGLSPVPHTPRVVEWLRGSSDRIRSLIGRELTDERILGLDMSVGSPLVASNPADNAAGPFSERVFAALHAAGATVGVGGYDEARVLYAADAFRSAGITAERRTVHIGIDVTLPAGSPLYAPLDGVVHGFEDAATRLDYGPVIVLRHEIADDEPLTFYTLYGHLDRQSLHGLHVGKRVPAGAQFATIGSAPDNGDWWPHVHFQIITDMLDVPCNFNGVALASQRRTWLSLSPDPNVLLRVPPERFGQRATTDELLSLRRRHFGDNVRLSYASTPLQIVRGWMQYLFDEEGRAYIDAYNNVPHVGHCHPVVTAAVAAQLGTLNTNSRYLHPTAVAYAAELAAQFPAPLDVCFFTASGSEANELALRLARAHTGARDVVVMDAAYHGHTTSLIDISPYKHAGPGGAGAPDWVHSSPIPDVYRGAYRANDENAGLKYARTVGDVIDAIRLRGRGVCGYIAETCPSVAGQILPPHGFLREVYRLVRAAGGLCIADEVQTGFGRMGTHFWAFAAHGVVPDIVVLGKPIANGYPMGAVVTTRAIADSFDNGMEFFSTFGGSTVACAAALATLRVTLDDDLQAHALRVGGHLLERLRELQRTHTMIGDVRGSGLFIGVELVRDRVALTPATEEAVAVVNRMRELGILVGTDGPHHNVIKIRGPMPLTVDDADRIVDALNESL